MKLLVSAGEASGELYAAPLVEMLRRRWPDAEFFGCAGPRMRAAGVRPIVDAASLSVVGIFEVVAHIPRIYREFRKLVRAAEQEKPAAAILADSPDFHLRLAVKLKRLGIPVVYLVAPQVWAWRRGRLKVLRRNVDRLLCIFPFEEKFFRDNSVSADYIGHPLATAVRPQYTRHEFLARYGIRDGTPLIAILPGSRDGERRRHLPALMEAIKEIRRHKDVEFVLGTPPGTLLPFGAKGDYGSVNGTGLKVVEGETWDLLAHSDVALTASGTVTIEAALLGTPMVTYYRVTAMSWLLGKALVRVPYYSMVNLIAERKIVPELMQSEMTGERLASEALRLLDDTAGRGRMKGDLAGVAERLRSGASNPIERAAAIVEEVVQRF